MLKSNKKKTLTFSDFALLDSLQIVTFTQLVYNSGFPGHFAFMDFLVSKSPEQILSLLEKGDRATVAGLSPVPTVSHAELTTDGHRSCVQLSGSSWDRCLQTTARSTCLPMALERRVVFTCVTMLEVGEKNQDVTTCANHTPSQFQCQEVLLEDSHPCLFTFITWLLVL